MPKYVKFLKDILTKKRRVSETEVIVLMQECNALVSNNLPKKQKDPRSFTVPCSIGGLDMGHALCDLGASINLTPLSIFKKLGISEAQPTSVMLQLANRTITCLKGKIEDVMMMNNVNLATQLELPEEEEVDQVCEMLQRHMRAIGWTLADIHGIGPLYCMHNIRLEKGKTGSIEPQRRLNPIMKEVVKKEIIKWLDARVIYPISDSSWLNAATKKDHFPLPFIDQMLDRLADKDFYCFLDGYSGYNQILIDPEDQEKTTFTCLFGTFAFRCMPFRLCNAPGTFQRCMMTIFSDFLEQTIEVFMDDFSVFGDSFQSCLDNLEVVLV
ncbi:uncharacterized protein LOC120090693 [Benincasa hispida]|uniref:uncharacterized protein LOC120090693 n=1 Tax=Benincasa hispida TaxID=102211 RepID=UPI0019020CCB|nr:uncharacterized protein LOC120090693 [Benincasa hispida]